MKSYYKSIILIKGKYSNRNIGKRYAFKIVERDLNNNQINILNIFYP